MCRSLSSRVALACALFVSGVLSADAASLPSGTLACGGVEGQLVFPNGLPTVNHSGPPRASKIKLKRAITNGCDTSGVTGGRFPITAAHVSLDGRTEDGETCGDFLGTLDLQKSKVTVKWRGFNNYARPLTIATSKATIASAVYDPGSERLVIVTNPVAKGAFAGSTVTLRVSFPETFEGNCTTIDASYAWFEIGSDGTSTIEVP